MRDGKGERKKRNQEGEGDSCIVHTCTCILYIGRESGSDTGRGETQGGRNGVRQEKNEERKDNAKTGIVVQYKYMYMYNTA